MSSPTPTPWPEGHLYVRFSGDRSDTWYELTSALVAYPHLTFDGEYFFYEGFSIGTRCRSDGRFHQVQDSTSIRRVPNPACVEDYRAECGVRYIPEMTPGNPGCFERGYGTSHKPGILNVAALGVLGKPWVADGLSKVEADALLWLDSVTKKRANEARLAGEFGEDWTTIRIVDMPFLQTLEDGEERTLRALSLLAVSHERFRAVMTHPSLRGGITDNLTGTIASMVWVVLETRPDGSRYSDAELIPRLTALLDSIS